MTSTPMQSRQRMRPERRRAMIIDAATVLLGRQGYWSFTMADVAREVGVSVQAVMHYFPTKDVLMLAVLEHRDEVDVQLVIPHDHVVKDAIEFVQVMTALVERNAGRREMVRLYTLLSAEAINEDHPAHQFFRRRFAWGIQSMSELAAAWHPHPAVLALHVHSVMDGLQLNWLRSPEIDLVGSWVDWAGPYFNVELPDGRIRHAS